MIYPIQIRAARSLLELSQDDLARLAGLGIVTIKRLEAAGTSIRGSARTVARIQRALEVAGVIFIDQDGHEGPGVRLRQPLPDA